MQAALFQRLATAIDRRMPALLTLAQGPGWAAPQQQLFQQLCQLRARLALLLAAQAPAVASGSPGDSPG